MAIFDAEEIGSFAEEEAKKLGISPKLFRKVVLSGEWHDQPKIDTSATSKKGAKGPAQVIEATWQGLIKNGAIPADADINDVRTNLRAGALVLKEQLDRSGGNEAAAVAGYNAGNDANDRVQRGEAPPAKETQDYLRRLGLGPQTPWLPSDDPQTPTGFVLARHTTKGGTPSSKVAATADLEAMIEQNRIATASFQKALFGGADKLNTAGDAITSYGDAAADVAEIQGGIDIAKLMQQQVVNSVLNVSVNDPDSVIVDAQKKRQEAKVKMDMLRPVIDEEDRVQVWDDPLRWIANQFTLPTLKKEYNQALRTDQAMVKRMADTQAIAKTQQELDPAGIADEIGRLAAAKAVAVKSKALEDASKAQAQSSEFTARAIQIDMITNDRSWDQRMQLARHFQDSLSYERQKTLDDKQTAEERNLQGIVDVVSTKLNSIGMPSINVATLKTLGKERVGRLIDWAQISALGNGPGDSMAAIREFGSEQAIAQKDPTLLRFINSLISSPEYNKLKDAKLNDTKFQGLSPQQQREHTVQELFYQQLQAVDKTQDNSSLPASSPYKLVHANALTLPALKDNPFAKEIVTAAATAVDQRTVDDKYFLLSFLGKVEAEPGKAKQHAAALAEYYTKATENQWAYGGASITGYPRFRRYGISDPWGSKPVNAMNALELEAWAVRRMAAKLRAKDGWSDAWGFPSQQVEIMRNQPDTFGTPRMR